MNNNTMWGFHTGEDAEATFLREGIIGIGWAELGDLKNYSSREACRIGWEDLP